MREYTILFMVVVAASLLAYHYHTYQRKKALLENIPRFFQEIYNNCASGMSLVKAIKKSKNVDYGYLTPSIKNLCTQIEWGVPFPVALKKFGRKINDPFVSNIISLVNKASEFSPNIANSMEDIYKQVVLTQELERERSSSLFPQLISLYLVFFVILATVYVLFQFFIPSFGNVNIAEYKTIFSHLIFIEAILSGLVIGRVAEGSFKAGVKHMIILLFVGIFFIYFYNI